ncbi:MAG: tetratricopeptide repeat protein [bacterium]|nr:tetratricopeptide repeat protein [bacterium]
MKWMFAGLFMAALLIGVGFLLTDQGTGTTISHSREAQELAEKGSSQVLSFKFSEGAENLHLALEMDPSLAEAAIDLSVAYNRMGRLKEYKQYLAMADSLTTTIEDDNRRMLAQVRLGLAHNSRYAFMVDSLLVQLKKSDPDNIHVMMAAFETRKMKGEVEDESLVWEKVLEINPNFAEAYNRLGYAAMYKGDYDQAIEHMKKYAFLAPNLANPHDSLGDVLTVIGQYEEAAREFRAAVAAQPDFYFSYINLAKTYLYRGMIDPGVEIIDQVHEMVAGTELGKKVDSDLLRTYLIMDMNSEANEMIQTFSQRYPDDEIGRLFQAFRLAALGQIDESLALRDSLFNHWHAQDYYVHNKLARQQIDRGEKQFEAFIADVADSPSTRVRKWEIVVKSMEQSVPYHNQWNDRIKLAAAYLSNGDNQKALDQLGPILEINNRVIPALVLAVKTDLAMKNTKRARQTLEQLKWSIQQSDEGYLGRQQTARLEQQVIELEGNS